MKRLSALLAAVLLASGCGGGGGTGSTEDLAKLSRGQQIQKLRVMIAQNPTNKDLQQKLGELALEEGDAQAAMDALHATGDAKGEAVAKMWMDPAQFQVPQGTAQELLAAATSVQLAIDSSFATRADVVAKLTRAGRLFFEAGDRENAGACVQRAQPIVMQILKTPRPSLLAYHLAADHDELYGDMLAGNRHWGDARALYQNNVMRFRNWNPPSDYTRKRLEEARRKVAFCEKKMMPE